MKFYCIFFLLFVFEFVSLFAQTDDMACDSEKCYRSVNMTYKKLLELIKHFSTTTSKAKITKPFGPVFTQIEGFFNDLKNIENGTKKLQSKLNWANRKLKHYENTVVTNENIIKTMNEKLENVSKISEQNDKAYDDLNKMIDTTRQRYKEFEDLASFNKNVSNVCQKSESDFKELKEIVNELYKSDKEFQTAFNAASLRAKKLNTSLQNTYQESVKNKDRLEQLKLPSSELEDYLLETESTLNSSITFLKDNSDILKNLLQDLKTKTDEQINRKVEEVTNTLSEIQHDLDIMNKKIEEFDEAILRDNFNSTIDEESKRLIEDIKTGIEQLENALKSFDFLDEDVLKNGNFSGVLKQVRNNIAMLKIYQKIIDALPQENEIEEIEAEIERFRISIYLIQQRQQLEEELKNLRVKRDRYLEADCVAQTGFLN